MTLSTEEDPQVVIGRIKGALPALVENLNADSRLPWLSGLTVDNLNVARVPSEFATGDAFNAAVRKIVRLDFRGKEVHAGLVGTSLTILKTSEEETTLLADLTFHDKDKGILGTATIEFDPKGNLDVVENTNLYRDGQPLGRGRGEYIKSDGHYLQALLTSLMLKSGDDKEPASGISCSVIDGIKFYQFKETLASDAGYMDAQVQITPRRLPQVRDDLAKEYKHIGPQSPFELSRSNKQYFTEIGTSLEESEEMWWVSEDMSKLAWDVAMSGTEPEDLSDDELPSPAGIMWLNGGGGPVLTTKRHPDVSFLETGETQTDYTAINAIIWYTPTAAYIPGLEEGEPRYMGLTASPDIVRETAQWNSLLSPMDIESNEMEFKRLPTYVTFYGLKFLPRKLALIVMRLAREEALAERTLETVGGQGKKKKGKERRRKIDTITCTSLRRYRYTSQAEKEAEAREFSHRWIVRGHMRNQPIGPRNAKDGQDHKRVWIAPYVKGPEDKPLVLKDRVQLFLASNRSAAHE